MGLVGSFGGIALGTPVIVVSGAIASEKSPIILKNQKREFYGTIVARDPGDDFSGSSCYCLN